MFGPGKGEGAEVSMAKALRPLPPTSCFLLDDRYRFGAALPCCAEPIFCWNRPAGAVPLVSVVIRVLVGPVRGLQPRYRAVRDAIGRPAVRQLLHLLISERGRRAGKSVSGSKRALRESVTVGRPGGVVRAARILPATTHYAPGEGAKNRVADRAERCPARIIDV